MTVIAELVLLLFPLYYDSTTIMDLKIRVVTTPNLSRAILFFIITQAESTEGADNSFVFALPDCIAVGGPQLALHLDDEFQNGSSRHAIEVENWLWLRQIWGSLKGASS